MAKLLFKEVEMIFRINDNYGLANLYHRVSYHPNLFNLTFGRAI